MHINLEKVENCNRVFQVDSFEKEYRALFGKNPFVFSRYQNKLLFNLQQLDAEGLKVLSFCERFEDLHQDVSGYTIYSIRHKSKTMNPRVLFFCHNKMQEAFILLNCFLEKSKSDYDRAIERAKGKILKLLREGNAV